MSRLRESCQNVRVAEEQAHKQFGENLDRNGQRTQVQAGVKQHIAETVENTAHPEIPAVGNYVTLTGLVESIDPVFRTLQIAKAVVPFEDLVDVSGDGIMAIDTYFGIVDE